MNQQDRQTVPLGAYISVEHRGKLDQMKAAGLKINAVVEQGIDAIYEQMVAAKVVAGVELKEEAA